MGLDMKFRLQIPIDFKKYLEKELVIYTSLIVREDAQLLYGFINEEEKDMFLSLIKGLQV